MWRFWDCIKLGVFGNSRLLGQERRLPLKLNVLAMSPLTALVMGFTFSFASALGEALTSVLLMAASAGARTTGFLLIGVYTIGFVLPFLAVGIFTTTVLEFFKNHGRVVRYTVKAGGILMVVMGVLMFTGKMNAVTGYLSGASSDMVKTEEQPEEAPEKSSGERASSEQVRI